MAEPAVDYPGLGEVGGIWELVDRRADLTPQSVMVTDELRRRVTFGEFRDRALRAAAGLCDHGVRPGTVVSWQLPSRIDTMVLFAALSRLGAVQNPLIMMLREPELEFICGQLSSRLLVVPERFRGHDHGKMADAIAAGQDGLTAMLVDGGLPEGDPATLPPPVPAGDAEARWIFYTSGTTSRPKGARHTDRGLLAAAMTYCGAMEPTPEDRIASLAPIAHVGGILHVLTSLISGASMIIADVFEPAAVAELLGECGVTIGGSGVPFGRAFLELQRARPDRPLFPEMKAFLVGGSPRPESLHYQIRDELGGVGLVSGYGLTECPYIAWGTLHDTDHEHATTEGRPGPGTDLRVVRGDGTLADHGETGELRVRAPQLMLGYVDRALDRDAFDEDGYFRTGDLAFLDERGYVTITGRLKDVIIRKMENISAREVEEHLITHPGVADAAVIGVPDEEAGERVCAVVVPADPAAPPGLAELCEHARGRGLNVRRLPERLEIVDELPRNAMGKVVKPRLRERFGAADGPVAGT
ncbi:class I adenylate-forming enzyme family protein [Actinomadura sp. SCN-SB]|uniref:class I adenylate-forming enzyme family protein n=1 Tax=Actinomadura sp. SCN-SB TaxID=3373092 RepID=UPI003751E672